MEALFRNTVSALCYEIAGQEAEGADAFLAPPYNDVVRLVERQLAGMPSILAHGVRLATLAFAVSSMPRHGVPFHLLPSPRRRVQVAAWSVSRLAPLRDIIKLYSSLVLLVLYSRKPCPAPEPLR